MPPITCSVNTTLTQTDPKKRRESQTAVPSSSRRSIRWGTATEGGRQLVLAMEMNVGDHLMKTEHYNNSRNDTIL